MLSRNQPTGLRLYFCDYSNLHISIFKYVLATVEICKESNSEFLIGNRFHLKLHNLGAENCKQA